MRRVVITGMGVITSCGLNVDDFWDKIKSGKHGFSHISAFDTDDFHCRYAAEIKDWDPTAHNIPKKEARRMDLYTQYAMAAANQAIENNKGFAEGLDPYRIGVLVGTGIGGFTTFEDDHSKFIEKGAARVSVFFIPTMISNMAAGQIAIAHGFKGDNFSPVSACSSSAHAIGEAFRKIKHGYLDAAVCGGAEATISKFAMGGFANMGALAAGDDPDRLSIPFDKERRGFVMGDGAGIIILEELERAKARGAHIYAEIVGYGATDDAHHMTSPDPSGEGTSKAMELAVRESGMSLADIGYINAHGTSTELNDKGETSAIKQLFGEHAYKLAVSSTKSMTGHLLGAAGVVESIITAKALEDGVLPPTAGYKVPDPECDLDYITEGARKTQAEAALSNSLGFGGHNVSLAIKRYI